MFNMSGADTFCERKKIQFLALCWSYRNRRTKTRSGCAAQLELPKILTVDMLLQASGAINIKVKSDFKHCLGFEEDEFVRI